MRGVPFDVRTYIKAVESYLDGRKGVEEIVKKTGMSEATFYNKLREYRNKGRIDNPHMQGKTGPKALQRTTGFNRALKELKREHPNYGRTRLTRELAKSGFMVGDWTTARALKELNLCLPPKKGGPATRSSITRHHQQVEGEGSRSVGS